MKRQPWCDAPTRARQTFRICYLPHASAGTRPRMRTSWIQLRSRPSHHLATGEKMKSWWHAQRSRIRVTGRRRLVQSPRGVCPRQAQRVSSCRRYLIAKQWGAPTPAAAHPGSHVECVGARPRRCQNSAGHSSEKLLCNLRTGPETSTRARLLARAGANALRCARRLVGAAAS